MFEGLQRVGSALFGKRLETFVDGFVGLRTELSHSGLQIDLTEYVYALAAAMLIAGIAVFPAVLFVFLVVGELTAVTAVVSLVAAILASAIVGLSFWLYPSTIATRAVKEIDRMLPIALGHMVVIAQSGAKPVTMFGMLSKLEEIGLISEEAERIVRDVKTLGVDVREVLRGAANRTASPAWRAVLTGIESTITTSGNMISFLREHEATALSEQRRRLSIFGSSLVGLEMVSSLSVIVTLATIGGAALISVNATPAFNARLATLQLALIGTALTIVWVALIIAARRRTAVL